jgi:hypothetical protein
MCLLNENQGFGYEEMLRMPAHIFMGMWGAKRRIIEERNKEQKGNDHSDVSVAGMQSQANRMMKSSMTSAPKMPHIPNIKLPR